MSNNSQFWGCKEQRALFGVLGIAIQETDSGKSQSVLGKTRVLKGLIKTKVTRLLKLSFKNYDWLWWEKEISVLGDRLSWVI